MLGNLLDFAGAFMSDRSQRKERSKDRRLAKEQFDAQMDQSVQRRVEDARKAGIHPLFAMGASVGASPTLSAGGGSRSGSAMGDALARIADRLGMTREREASAMRDEAEAQLMNSQRKKLEQDLVSRGHDGARLGPGVEWGPPEEGPHLTVPPEVPATMPGKPAREAGVRPPYVEFRRDDGSKGLAFGVGVPGAEELNAFWIPLQNWWHSSKEARRRLREKLGITTSEYSRMRSNPAEAEAFLRRNKEKIRKMKREWSRFEEAASGRPVR